MGTESQHDDVGKGVVLYPQQERAIHAVLEEIASKAAASLVLVTTHTGHFVASNGGRAGMDIAALGSLIAADLAASQQIARLIDETEAYQMVLREGDRINMFVSEAGPALVLLVVVPSAEPVGWVRILVREGSRKLAAITQAPLEPIAEPGSPATQGELADLIGNALDKLWTG
jgi:predicted regulator of Ras-like GTPase activity (Roadblock/LC7/MglB family)